MAPGVTYLILEFRLFHFLFFPFFFFLFSFFSFFFTHYTVAPQSLIGVVLSASFLPPRSQRMQRTPHSTCSAYLVFCIAIREHFSAHRCATWLDSCK